MDLTFLPPRVTTSRARFTVRSASSPSYRPAACRPGGGGGSVVGLGRTPTAPAATREDSKGRDATGKTDTPRVDDGVNGALLRVVASGIASRSETREEGGGAGGVQTAHREDEGNLKGSMAAVRASQRDAGDGENSGRAERTTRLYQRNINNNNTNKSNGLERRDRPSSSPEPSGTTMSSSGGQGERERAGWDRDRVEVTTSPAEDRVSGVKTQGLDDRGVSGVRTQAPEDRLSGVRTQGLDDRGVSGVKTQGLDDRGVSGVRTQAPEDRLSGVRTLPSRLKSRSMSGSTSGQRESSVSLGPKGGQSIWERIEKLYGSTTADDPTRAKRLSAPLEDWRLPSRLDGAPGAGRRGSTAPDFPLSAPVSPWRDVCVSGGGGGSRQISREARGSTGDVGATWGATSGTGMTMSLDRSRGRQCVAAQIRRARAAGATAETAAAPSPTAAATPQGEGDGAKARLPDPSGLREGRRASGIKERGAAVVERGGEADVGKETAPVRPASNGADRVGGGEPEKDRRTADASRAKTVENVREANAPLRKAMSLCEEKEYAARDADAPRKGSLCEGKFKSAAQKIHVKSTAEAKKLVVPSAASVRNKISQYEALTQRAAGAGAGVPGQHQKPRRAFSVPGELDSSSSSSGGGESDGGVGRLRGRWDRGAVRVRTTTTSTTAETGGVRKSWSDRAIDELKSLNRTTEGRGDGGDGGSGRTTAEGIRGEPREEKERRRETRPNAGSVSTGDVVVVASVPNARELGDAGGSGGDGRNLDPAVDRESERPRCKPRCQRDVDDVVAASDRARALSLPLSDSNNNDDNRRTYNGDDDATPTNPDQPCFSAAVTTGSGQSDRRSFCVSDGDADTAVTVPGDGDGAAVPSVHAGQKLSSEPSRRGHRLLPSVPPGGGCTTTSTASAPPGKLPEGDPSSPLQGRSGSAARNQGGGADDTLETWVKSQGAAEDSLEAWVTTWNQRIQGWSERDSDDDDEGTEKDYDSNYDSDESSATITSSQSDRRSFCVSLADLCNLGGVEYGSDSDSSSSEDWSNSLRSDMSALSYVSVMPAEELERLLQDVRGLGDSTLQSYEDVQVVVLHKDVGVGLGFSIAGGLDQNKPVTVHKVFPTGAAAQEGSVREGDHVLSINGSTLCGSAHLEVLRTLRRAKERSMGVVVLRRGAGRGAAATAPYKAGGGGGGLGGGVQGSAAQTPPPTTTGQRVCVRLDKRSRDLGFSLEGGAGSSLGDKPLSIQKIFQGGPGEQVCPGDQLLQIQDVSVVGMRRLEVWTLIKTLPPGPVDVVLHRPHTTPQT